MDAPGAAPCRELSRKIVRRAFNSGDSVVVVCGGLFAGYCGIVGFVKGVVASVVRDVDFEEVSFYFIDGCRTDMLD